MTHEDKGKYAEKHQDQQVDKEIAGRLSALAEKNNITCAAAHKAAKDLNTTPETIGAQIDLLEYRICNCQLGLFGHSTGKEFDTEKSFGPEIFSALENASDNGKIACKACWDIATELKMTRNDIGSACEQKGIKIYLCQLGTF